MGGMEHRPVSYLTVSKRKKHVFLIFFPGRGCEAAYQAGWLNSRSGGYYAQKNGHTYIKIGKKKDNILIL
jgi:hypothetical protein